MNTIIGTMIGQVLLSKTWRGPGDGTYDDHQKFIFIPSDKELVGYCLVILLLVWICQPTNHPVIMENIRGFGNTYLKTRLVHALKSFGRTCARKAESCLIRTKPAGAESAEI